MGTKLMYIFLKLAKFILFTFGLFVFCACLKCGNYVLFRLMLILSEKKFSYQWGSNSSGQSYKHFTIVTTLES